MPNPDLTKSLDRLIEIGLALSAERDIGHLIERIFLEAKAISNADGASLYLREGDDLKFESLHVDSLGVAQGGITGVEVDLPSIELYVLDGEPNHMQLASQVAHTGEVLNISDVHQDERFDLSASRLFDEAAGYQTTSILTMPLKNSQDLVIAVIQLVNAIDQDTGEVVGFSDRQMPLLLALASQAAVALETHQLLEHQKALLDSFIQLIASAVDAKSPYTGGHCQRVPTLTNMLAQAACDDASPSFADFALTEDEWYELHIAGWLHDCGKVTTPEYVVDKATKLETITNRVHEIRMRFEVVKCDTIIEYQQALLDKKGDPLELKIAMEARLQELDRDFAFIAEANIGSEFMTDEDVARVQEIASTTWSKTISDRQGISGAETKRKNRLPEQALPAEAALLADRVDHLIEHDLLVPAAEPENNYRFKLAVPEYKYNLGEIHNLSIQRGTLTEEERFKINDHIMQTIVMLEKLRFPEHLQNVPEYAAGHHERMDGRGYPRKLNGEEMSIPARIMAIADVFEALTAADRPYKAPKTLSESIRIMSYMAKEEHIDADLFQLFLSSGVYMSYARDYLEPFQMDEVDLADYLES